MSQIDTTAQNNNAIDPDLARDAARWRALMSSQRMHFMGFAGFNLESPNGPDDRKIANQVATVRQAVVDGKDWLHFGMEFWNVHHAFGKPEFPDTFERRLLTTYADFLIEHPPGAAGKPASEDGLETRKLLLCSTANVPREVAETIMATHAAHLPFAGGHYGINGWFTYAHDEQGDIPDELFAVMTYARLRGFDHILFDNDAAAIEDLPIWEW